MLPHDDDHHPTTTETATARSTRWLVGGLLAAGALVGIGAAAALAGDDGTEAMRAAPPTVDTTVETTAETTADTTAETTADTTVPVDDTADTTVPVDDATAGHDHTHTHEHEHEHEHDGSCDCPTVEDTIEDAADAEDAVGADAAEDAVAAEDEWYGDDPFEGMSDSEIDALSDEEFEQILEDAGWILDDEFDDELGDDDHGDHTHDDWAELAPLGSFEVDGDRIDTSGVDADTAALAERIWSRFVTLIPADQRQMLVRFELLTADEGGHVYQDENDPTRWVMGIGSDLGNEEDYVLIHEFAHLLTLQAGEVPPADDDGSCPTYHTGEGCALSDSTFAGFVDRFWSDDLLEQLESDGPDAVYDDDPSRFVTDYAATNPAEDLAETFTAFVLRDRPSGDTVADQKVQFLWDDVDMVALRDQIRAEL